MNPDIVIWIMTLVVTIIYSVATGDYTLPTVFLTIVFILWLLKKRYGERLDEAVGKSNI